MFLLLAALIYAPAMMRVGTSKHLHRQSTARLTAEAALATAISQLVNDSTFGQNPTTPPVTVEYEDSRAIVFFTPPSEELQRKYGVDPERDRSLNLFGKDTSAALPSDARYQVYAGQIHLVAVAECQGTFLRKRARLTLPPFPFCIASSGSFSTSGSLLLGSVKPGLDVRGQFSEDDLLPAEVVANGTSTEALVLQGEALIVGNATTPAPSAEVSPTVRFLRGGQARTGAKAESLPIVDLARYDPASRSGVQTVPEAHYPNLKAVEGLSRRSGSVTFAQGLRLNGLLYVDGDVVIESGGLTGSGALVCTGKVTIRGGSDFVADSRCAVVAGGDVALSGTGRDSSYYQGLLYSAGSGGISVEGVTLLGAAVASAPGGARVAVKDARVVYDPKATRVTSGEVGFGAAYPPGGFQTRAFGTGTIYLRLKPVTLPGPPPQVVANPTPATFAAVGVSSLTADDFELVDAQGRPVAGDVADAFRVADEKIALMNGLIAAANSNEPLLSGGKFDFDLNRFMNTADRLRIVWRD